MENLAEKITIFLAAHNYIAEDKKDWCHYHGTKGIHG